MSGEKGALRIPVYNDAVLLKLVGSQIRSYRLGRGWTQQDLLDALYENTSTTMISRYETGQTNMSMTTYLRIAAALGKTPNDLAAIREGTDCAANVSLLDLLGSLSDDNRAILKRIALALSMQQASETNP